MTKYNVVLDVWHQMPETVVTALQGEINSRFLEITITDKGSFFNLTGKTVMVYMTKPDGKIIFNSCSVVDAPNGKISVSLTSQMSIVAGTIRDFEIHIIGSDKTRLKITGVCLKIKETANADEAIESTNEFTALIEALSKVDGSLEYIEQFLKEKEQEIDGLKQNVEDLIQQIKTDGAQAIQEVNQNFNSAMTGFTQEIDAAVKKAEDAAGKSEEIARQAATDTVNSQKNKANGIAGLNLNGKLQQMPTVDDIGTSAIFLASHRVGDLYFTTTPTNPSTVVGGTWAAWGGGRTPVGVNPADTDFKTVEKTGGEKTHTLTVDEITPHSHIETVYWNAGGSGTAHPAAVEAGDPRKYGGLVARTENTGGGQAHNNLQPYITCYIWKRTT